MSGVGDRGEAHLGRASVARHLGRDTGERCPSVDRSCTQEVRPALSAPRRPGEDQLLEHSTLPGGSVW
jgi:hypothetical protein